MPGAGAGAGRSKDRLRECGLGDVHATWHHFSQEFPGKGLRGLHASAGATRRAHTKEEHGGRGATYPSL